MNKHIKILVLTAALFITPHAGAASLEGWYAGAGPGVTSADMMSKGVDRTAAVICPGATSCNTSADTGAVGFGLFGGFRVNENLAFEIGFMDLGTYEGTINAAGAGATLGVLYTAETEALSFSVVGFLPVTTNKNGAVIGKLGIAKWKVDLSGEAVFCILGSCVTDTASDSESGTSVLAGIGYEHRFGHVGVRGLFEVIPKVGLDPYYDDVKRLSVNVTGYF